MPCNVMQILFETGPSNIAIFMLSSGNRAAYDMFQEKRRHWREAASVRPGCAQTEWVAAAAYSGYAAVHMHLQTGITSPHMHRDSVVCFLHSPFSYISM